MDPHALLWEAVTDSRTLTTPRQSTAAPALPWRGHLPVANPSQCSPQALPSLALPPPAQARHTEQMLLRLRDSGADSRHPTYRWQQASLAGQNN